MSDLFELTIAAISWEPQIRGMLAVLIGFVVLCGSVYLLLATNSGVRTGLLLAIAGLFGWMSIMGIIWWMYGIGWVGDAPSWQASEINWGEPERAVTEVLQEDPSLEDWELIAQDDPAFGELQAAATDTLTEAGSFESPADFIILDAHETGGKPDRESDSVVDRVTNRVTNTLRITHPTHYAVVRVQQVIDQGEPGPGEAPPTPEADTTQPVVHLVLIRDIGNLRLLPAVFTFFSMVVFGITANALHRRDKMEAENRARTEPVTAGV
ncbi:hypothetical protein [Actinomarinicola tropica]|uniref:Uncharacterized protein n=1 Tax=Actinomarinicola tropica TaxID=2789776 RepID=A0A5Q2RGZ8_9ACTN|nr:hypothetical protein [Actinomarinicola tropica]QGG93801.1 hypothetical protein GH723_01005 [Actinomarinicola tropica]